MTRSGRSCSHHLLAGADIRHVSCALPQLNHCKSTTPSSRYLIFGSLATKIKKLEKEKAGIAEARGGARGPENLWGSAATAALCAIGGSVYVEWQSYLAIGFVASLATKLSDTIASEIGKAYGKTTYLITTLQKVPRGTEGAVSCDPLSFFGTSNNRYHWKALSPAQLRRYS